MAEVHEQLENKMSKTIDALKKDYNSVRTGRATPNLLDTVKVDYYGTPTPISQMATVTAPEPQLLVINPWDKSQIKEIERTLQKANLGLNLSNDGNFIRATVPTLTEDRRKELVKNVKKMGEDAKIAIRNIRREANEAVKKFEKNKEISQDEEKVELDKIQKVTDSYIEIIGEVTTEKEKELMTI